MKPFVITLALLLSSVVLLASGVDSALDQLCRSQAESSFTIFSDQGTVLFAYDGDLGYCRAFTKPVPVVTPSFLHRT